MKCLNTYRLLKYLYDRLSFMYRIKLWFENLRILFIQALDQHSVQQRGSFFIYIYFLVFFLISYLLFNKLGEFTKALSQGQRFYFEGTSLNSFTAVKGNNLTRFFLLYHQDGFLLRCSHHLLAQCLQTESLSKYLFHWDVKYLHQIFQLTI